MLEFIKTQIGLRFFSVDFVNLSNACVEISKELKRSNDLKERELKLNEKSLKFNKMVYINETKKS